MFEGALGEERNQAGSAAHGRLGETDADLAAQQRENVMYPPGPDSHDGQPADPKPSFTAPLISDEAISPENPPDAKDAFKLLVEGAGEYAVLTLSPAGLVSTWNRGAERIKG